MSEIKSEKAKGYLSNQNIPHYEIYSMGSDRLMGIDITDAKEAIIIAETEAEERHSKELQDMRDKAIESFKDIMFDVMMESRDGKFIPEDYCLTNFLTHLNK